jgi:hypothetical protein
LTVPTAQLFTQAVSEQPSVCIKACCPLAHQPLAVAYAKFIKSAAQRLGPTPSISGGAQRRPLHAVVRRLRDFRTMYLRHTEPSWCDAFRFGAAKLYLVGLTPGGL